MGIIETIRQRIRGRQGDASFAELEMLLQSLRSCQPQAYYEEAENVMGSSELSVQDSVIASGRLWALSCWGGIVFVVACIIMALTKPEDD